jgi:hypothetical protein
MGALSFCLYGDLGEFVLRAL